MALLKENYNRVFITVFLFLFFLITGAFAIKLNIKFAGTLMMMMAISLIGYLLIFWFLTYKNYIKDFGKLTGKETKWLSILMGILYLIGILEADPTHALISILFTLALLSIIAFLFMYHRSIKKGKNIIRSWSISKFSFWSLIIHISTVLVFIISYTFETKATSEGNLVLLENDELVMDLLFPMIFFMIIVFFISWLIRQIKSIIDLKNEKKKNELLHLKSQVNPHFFFNTLNNLYGLVEEDKQKAQKLILKLSDMMRYSIYEGQRDFVTLEQEIEYLKNYIELHKMRYHKQTKVNFDYNVKDKTSVIMPLLFIILLENAFKHGIENLRKEAYINIQISSTSNQIDFSIENNFDPAEVTSEKGIGLQNLKRRLELVYPHKHSLSFTVIENLYKAQLTLQLK